MANIAQIAGVGSAGLFMINGPPKLDNFEKFSKIPYGQLRIFTFNHDGSLMAWADGTGVQIISLPDCVLLKILDAPKASALHFSPLGRFIATWQTYTTAGAQQGNPDCNLHIFETLTGTCVKSFHQKKQAGWEPQWSDDEKIVARNVNNEVHFFEDNNFDVIVKKIFLQKISDFSLSRGKPPYHVMCYVQGSKGQPSSIRLFQYPNFDGNAAMKAMKSFFKADQVTLQWNKKGTGVLALTVTDVDKSGSSYYGEQKLYLLTTSGDSMYVQLPKEGPIYSFEWNPSSNEFCVVYGYMPAKATLFNGKGDIIFDFGTSPRNLIYYNTFGTVLILAGFGNLNGHVEIWDLQKKKEIIRTQARDTTFLQWGPDGEHFLTATLSPRLRVGNGYRVWHYSGSLIHEVFCHSEEDLRQIQWRPVPAGTFKEKKVVHAAVPSIASAQPQASKEVYRPPGARGLPNVSKLHEEFEKPSNALDANVSKQTLKNRKRKEAAKRIQAAKAAAGTAPDGSEEPKTSEVKQVQKPAKKEAKIVSEELPDPAAAAKRASEKPVPSKQVSVKQVPSKQVPVKQAPSKQVSVKQLPSKQVPVKQAPTITNAPGGDDAKKIRYLTKKLGDIELLKKRQADGEILKDGQIEKIGKEAEVKSEIKKLQQQL